jgi:hypothetical protein
MATNRPRKSLVGALFAGTVLLVSTILMFAPSVASSATSGSGVEPTFVSGNPSCADLGYSTEFKVEPVSSGTFSDGTITVGITVVNTAAGPTFDWTATRNVEAVIAKGGPNANLYVYDPPATADTGLHAPVGPSGDYFGLSHISFCYDPTVFGSFEVTKQVTGATDGYVAGSTFTVAYDCDDGSEGTLTLADGETDGVSGLPLGTTCTLSETAKPDTAGPSYVWGAESWNPSNVVVIATETKVSVTLTNPLDQRLGAFEVTKQVTGATDGYVAGSTFTVAYDCTDGTQGSFQLTDGQTSGVSGLPVGTTCTLSETAKPDTTAPSYVWGTESWDPSNVVLIADTSTVKVKLTNPLERRFGSFEVTKQVTGATDGYVAGSTFTVAYDCDDGSEGTLTLADGETDGVSGLPLGTTCTLSETAKPDTAGPSYVWGAESWNPSNVVVIATETKVSVTLTNPLDQRLGAFEVTKQVTGATDGYVAGSTFTVAYDCDDGSEGTLTLADGETDGVSGLPVGTTCTLSETAKPDTAGPSYVWGAESWNPSNVVVIGDTSTVSVTLTNPLQRVLGGLVVTKQLTGAVAGYVAGSAFGFELDCDGDDHDGSFTLGAGDSISFGDIPLGTSCAVTEVSVPDAAEGFEYGTPVLVPVDGTVVIDSEIEPVTVLVQNPLDELPEAIAEVITPPAVAGIQQAPQVGVLPVTGAQVLTLLVAALGLLAGGTFLVRRTRRAD